MSVSVFDPKPCPELEYYDDYDPPPPEPAPPPEDNEFELVIVIDPDFVEDEIPW